MSEDDEEADLLMGLKIAPRRIMAKIPKLKPKIKHFMFLTFIVVLVYILIYNINRTHSDDLIEQKKMVRKGLKSPTFCSAESLVSRIKLLEEDSKKSSKTRTPSRVLLVPKTSYSKC